MMLVEPASDDTLDCNEEPTVLKERKSVATQENAPFLFPAFGFVPPIRPQYGEPAWSPMIAPWDDSDFALSVGAPRWRSQAPDTVFVSGFAKTRGPWNFCLHVMPGEIGGHVGLFLECVVPYTKRPGTKLAMDVAITVVPNPWMIQRVETWNRDVLGAEAFLPRTYIPHEFETLKVHLLGRFVPLGDRPKAPVEPPKTAIEYIRNRAPVMLPEYARAPSENLRPRRGSGQSRGAKGQF